MKKILSGLLAAALAFGTMAVLPAGFADISVAASAELVETKDGTKYKNDDGTYAKSKFITEGENTYYFDKNGVMKTGWLTMKSGKKYYFKKDGTMAAGWLKISGKQYHFSKKGVMTTGDAKIGKKIYCFNDDGTLYDYYAGGVCRVDGKLYCVDDDGNVLYGIQQVDYTDGTYTYYYFGKNGYAVSHEEVLDRVTYVFDEEEGLTDAYIKVSAKKDFTDDASGAVSVHDFKVTCSATSNILGLYEVKYSGYVKFDASYMSKTKPLTIRVYANFLDENNYAVSDNDMLIAKCKLYNGQTYTFSDSIWVSKPVYTAIIMNVLW